MITDYIVIGVVLITLTTVINLQRIVYTMRGDVKLLKNKLFPSGIINNNKEGKE